MLAGNALNSFMQNVEKRPNITKFHTAKFLRYVNKKLINFHGFSNKKVFFCLPHLDMHVDSEFILPWLWCWCPNVSLVFSLSPSFLCVAKYLLQMPNVMELRLLLLLMLMFSVKQCFLGLYRVCKCDHKSLSITTWPLQAASKRNSLQSSQITF